MKLKYFNKSNQELIKKWDDFVNSTPQGSLFSLSSYLNALNVNYKILSVIENNEIIAGIVLAKNQIHTYSNPLLDKYLGILFKGEEILTPKKVSKQYKAMELLAKELKKYKTFDYYFHPGFFNWIPFYWNGFAQQTRYTYQINLNKLIDSIETEFYSSLKNDLKKSTKEGVVIKREVDFDDFYNIINKTFLRQGSKAPFRKEKLKKIISKLIKDNFFVSFGAYNKEGLLISVCGLIFDKKASYLILNGIDIENHVRGANALMIFEAIKYSKEKDLSIFDFEGSMLPGIERFYRSFGGNLIPYFRIWNDNFFNYTKTRAKKIYKRFRYGR